MKKFYEEPAIEANVIYDVVTDMIKGPSDETSEEV